MCQIQAKKVGTKVFSTKFMTIEAYGFIMIGAK